MNKWISVGSEDMLKSGTMQEIKAEGQTVLLVRVGKTYYALQPRCPHLKARLVKGTLKERVLVCPAHGSTFDVTTGRNKEWVEKLPGVLKGVANALSKPKNLTTYPAKVDGGQVWVRVEVQEP